MSELNKYDNLNESKRIDIENKLKDRGIDTSIEDAMRMLERLKAAHIAVGKDGEIQVYRKLRNIDGKLRKLVEWFRKYPSNSLHLPDLSSFLSLYHPLINPTNSIITPNDVALKTKCFTNWRFSYHSFMIFLDVS